MSYRLATLFLAAAVVAACTADDQADPGSGVTADVEIDGGTGGAAAETTSNPAGEQVALACSPSRMPLPDRPSPYDSTSVQLGQTQAKVCYGRPSARDRQIFGGLVPYDTLWRTGANEPTIIHLPVAAEIAGIAVEPGSYSIYTVPGREEWTVIVNASTSQWGIETSYTPEVRAEEVGRATVPAESIDEHVETFVIRSEPQGDAGSDLVLEWENTRVRVPVRRS